MSKPFTVTAVASVPETATPAPAEVWDFLASNDAPIPEVDGEMVDLDRAWVDRGAVYVTDTDGRVWRYEVPDEHPFV